MKILRITFFKSLLIFAAFLCFFVAPTYAEKIEDLKPTNYVNDYAGVIDQRTEQSINNKLFQLEQQTGDQITIVTIKSMDGDYIEHYAVKLFEVWKVGDSKLDNGAIVLVAVDERQMRIEVGYGLEPRLTDGKSIYIINNILKPNFQEGNYGLGLEEASDEIINILNGTNTVSDTETNSSDSRRNNSSLLNLLFNLAPVIFFFGFVFFQWLVAVLGRTKSWWLGGVLGAMFGLLILFIIGISLLSQALTILFALIGLIFDYFVSKNYKEHKSGFLDGPPDWWSGSTWGPGSGTWTGSSGGGSNWGGFGGGSSGGGGASGSW